MINQLYMYAMIFENRMYRVVLDTNDVKSLDTNTRIATVIRNATMVIDLQTRQIINTSLDENISSITTSNPLYHILVSLPLVTFSEMKRAEPQVFL